MLFSPPSPTYIGPPAHSSPGANKPIYRIVIHSTVSPCVPGGARQIARYFQQENAGGSAHYVVDPEEVVQAAYDNTICWHAPPNPGTLGIEMCDIPGPIPSDKPTSAKFKAALKVWRWNRKEQKAMLRLTAELTAELCLAYDVPIRFLGWRKLRSLGRTGKGITTHDATSDAFGQSTHWDPGFWPKRKFMRMVRKHAAELMEAQR